MRAAFTPIEACASEMAAQHASCRDINPKSLERLGSVGAEIICVVIDLRSGDLGTGGLGTGDLRAGRKPPQCPETVVQRYPYGARQVIVASTRATQPAWRGGHELVA